jgi:hypothetical protein
LTPERQTQTRPQASTGLTFGAKSIECTESIVRGFSRVWETAQDP